MNSRDLRDVLDKLAGGAPDLRGYPRAEMRRRIVRRRRIASAAVASAGLVTTLGVVAGVSALATRGGSEELQPQQRPQAAKCGESIGGVAGDTRGMGLTLTSPTELSADKNGFARLRLALHNRSGEPVEGAAGNPLITVAQDGVVVAETGGNRPAARAVRLASGESQAIDASVNLVRCEKAIERRLLPPGRYVIYATQSFQASSADGHQTGELATIWGGPWQVDIQ